MPRAAQPVWRTRMQGVGRRVRYARASSWLSQVFWCWWNFTWVTNGDINRDFSCDEGMHISVVTLILLTVMPLLFLFCNDLPCLNCFTYSWNCNLSCVYSVLSASTLIWVHPFQADSYPFSPMPDLDVCALFYLRPFWARLYSSVFMFYCSPF